MVVVADKGSRIGTVTRVMDQVRMAGVAGIALSALMSELIEERRANPTDDLTSKLVNNDLPEDLLTPEEITVEWLDAALPDEVLGPVLFGDRDEGRLELAGNGTLNVDSIDVTGFVAPGGAGISYTPDASFSGTDTFRYTVANSAGVRSSEATVEIPQRDLDAILDLAQVATIRRMLEPPGDTHSESTEGHARTSGQSN